MNDRGTFLNKKYYIMFVELEFHNFGNLPYRGHVNKGPPVWMYY